MNRVKLTVSDESGKTLCKIGTSIDLPAGPEYNDKELADMLADTATMLYQSHAQREQVGLNAESLGKAPVMLIESQETPYEV